MKDSEILKAKQIRNYVKSNVTLALFLQERKNKSYNWFNLFFTDKVKAWLKITLTEKQDVKKQNCKPLVIEEIVSNGYKIPKTFNKTFVNIVPNLTTDPKGNFEKTQSSFTCSNQQWKHQKK